MRKVDGFEITLNSPLTEEQWDAIVDVDFEHTDRIWFHTKHGKEVEFVKRKRGNWIPVSERLPDVDDDGYTDKVLVSFDKYCGVEICEYRIINGVGKWYAGDTDDAPEDLGLRITAWMPLPESYMGDKE